MKLATNAVILQLLRDAAAAGDIQAEQFLATDELDTVEWFILKHAKDTLLAKGEQCSLRDACQGSRLALEPPRKRQVDPEFRKLLEERRRAAQQAEYDSLVADVTQTEQAAEAAASRGFLPTARLQMSQGIHVCVTMGVGYALGATAGRGSTAFGDVTPQLCGVVGLIIALIFETTLFITRANMSSGSGSKYERLLQPGQWAAKQQEPTPIAGEGYTTQPAAAAAKVQRPQSKEPKKLR